MIYVQIDTRLHHQSPDKRRGDALVAKRLPLFSPNEQRFYCVIEIDDPTIGLLFDRNKLTEDQPLIEPYKGHDEDGNEIRSTKWLDIESMPADVRDRITDPERYVELLTWADVSDYWGDR